MNGCSGSRIDGVACWSCGKKMHLRRNCLKRKDEKGKRIVVEFANDVATVANGNLDSANYVLSVTTDSSFDGRIWLFVSCYTK